ncbi:hypothetical protein DB42_BB00220 [Neochlamydia sp. EPS4]|nr:hypothetical protein DB42_BB00220 [Neochlamydia sp. EPS4]
MNFKCLGILKNQRKPILSARRAIAKKLASCHKIISGLALKKTSWAYNFPPLIFLLKIKILLRV